MKIKTKSKLLIAILTLATIMGFFTFAIRTTRADSEVIYVDPPFSPEIDTENIENALQDAPPGSTVILREGQYCLTRPILVADFDGTFKGQGKGKTIITNFFDDGHPFPAEPYYMFRQPTFFTFYLDKKGTNPDLPANIEIADMTIKAIGYTVEWIHHYPDNVHNLILIRTSGKFYYNAKFSGIEILGQWGLNVREGLAVWADGQTLSGEFIISDCNIENTEFPFVFGSWGLDPAPPKMKNSYIEIFQNTFTNSIYNGGAIWKTQNTDLKITQNKMVTSWGGLILQYNNHLNAKISRNTLLNSPGFYFWNNDECSFLIEHNDIIMPIDSLFAGIEVWEHLSEKKPDIVISHNKIHSENSLYYGPIWMFGVSDALISNNIITGTGPAAMYIGLWGEDVTGLMIKGNNFENWQVAGYGGWFPGVAPIWLGWATSNCIVVGHAKQNVADDGMDNILVGVDKIQGPIIGQEIKDAMEQKKDLMNFY